MVSCLFAVPLSLPLYLMETNHNIHWIRICALFLSFATWSHSFMFSIFMNMMSQICIHACSAFYSLCLCLCFSLSLCLSLSLSLCLCVSLSLAPLSLWVSVHKSIHICFCTFISLGFCPQIDTHLTASVLLFFWLSVHTWLSLHLYLSGFLFWEPVWPSGKTVGW